MFYKDTDKVEAIKYYENDLKEEKLMRNYLLLLIRNNFEATLYILNHTEENEIEVAVEKLNNQMKILNNHSAELITTRYSKVKNEGLEISDVNVQAFIHNINVVKKNNVKINRIIKNKDKTYQLFLLKLSQETFEYNLKKTVENKIELIKTKTLEYCKIKFLHNSWHSLENLNIICFALLLTDDKGFYDLIDSVDKLSEKKKKLSWIEDKNEKQMQWIKNYMLTDQNKIIKNSDSTHSYYLNLLYYLCNHEENESIIKRMKSAWQSYKSYHNRSRKKAKEISKKRAEKYKKSKTIAPPNNDWGFK